MDNIQHQALRTTLDHATSSTIKQLQDELEREKAGGNFWIQPVDHDPPEAVPQHGRLRTAMRPRSQERWGRRTRSSAYPLLTRGY